MQTESYEVPRYKLSLVKEGTAHYAARSVNHSENAAKVIGAMLQTEPVENFVALYLDGRNRIMGSEVVSRGGLHGCAITPAEVFRGAIVACASAVILGHNHPSGDPTPSRDDLEMTRAAVAAGKMLGIPILDHVVVTREGAWHSIHDSNTEIF
jgi:DNA repair protein RadC